MLSFPNNFRNATYFTLRILNASPLHSIHFTQVVVDVPLDIVDSPVPDSTSFVVIGGSGDLAKKKTFPSLYVLYCLGLIPPNTTFYGYSRSKMSDEEFRKHASQ